MDRSCVHKHARVELQNDFDVCVLCFVLVYLSELVSHKEGRRVGFGLHVGHVRRRLWVEVIRREHLRPQNDHIYTKVVLR